MNDLRNGLCAFACMLLANAIPSGLTYADDRHDDDRHHGDRDFRIEVLSSRPYMVSGGDALEAAVAAQGRQVDGGEHGYGEHGRAELPQYNSSMCRIPLAAAHHDSRREGDWQANEGRGVALPRFREA